jgi:hypothetical protein
MCNENNVMQKFYHPLRMTGLWVGRTLRDFVAWIDFLLGWGALRHD